MCSLLVQRAVYDYGVCNLLSQRVRQVNSYNCDFTLHLRLYDLIKTGRMVGTTWTVQYFQSYAHIERYPYST